jgi:amino acid adenylation domain-containing protein
MTALVHSLIDQAVATGAARLAVICGADVLTYGELGQRASLLARRLRARGVGADVVVAVCMEPSIDLIVALLAVLKAGGAYLPIDPTYPEERLRLLIADASPGVLLTDRASSERLASAGLSAVVVDRDEATAALPLLPPVCIRPENLAYVIYTSGSTGRPKGVAVSHRSLANLVAWHCAAYGLTRQDRSSQLASIGFDAATWEIWPTLAAGATLVIAERRTRSGSPDDVIRLIRDHGVTVAFLVTPLVNQLLASRDGRLAQLPLRTLLTGGDVLLAVPDGALPFDLVNHYGPTEGTVVATAATVGADTAIGTPISNMDAYVVDAGLAAIPDGGVGELCIAGVGLARGYLGRPAHTAERFVPNPFGPPGSRMYRTGDRALRRPADGHLEFRGRLDTQVKIRGYRIEPTEVETAMLSHPDVRQVAVAAVARAEGKQLVAFVVMRPAAERSVAALRSHLRQQLPDYMVPGLFDFRQALPLTPNGKVDRAALAAGPIDAAGADYTPPRTPVEARLAEIWAQVLERPRVGIHDNFFEAGGDSILAVQVVARAARAGLRVELGTLLERQTVAGLAAAVADTPVMVAS